MSRSTAICRAKLVNHKPFVVAAEIESVHVSVKERNKQKNVLQSRLIFRQDKQYINK